MNVNIKIAIRSVLNLFLITGIFLIHVNAGNPDRVGEAGASHLLINPWARSSGWNGLNTATVHGIEALRLNVAGLSFTEQTEIVLAHTRYLAGTGISLNALGFSQKVGAAGVIGFCLMTMNFGEIEITQADFPEGGLGTYNPQVMNLGLSYAKIFSNSIHGGITLRVLSESITDVKAAGIAIDLGIQYVTGPKDNIKFGLAMRNVGLPIKYSGSGLSFRDEAPTDPDKSFFKTLQQPSATFELPSLLNIGGAYDILFDSLQYRITIVGNFTSNAFGKDQMGLGVEFAFFEKFMLRVGYRYEEGITKNETRTTALTGFSGGLTVELPISNDGSTIALDYAYRTTNPFKGIHNIGVRVNL